MTVPSRSVLPAGRPAVPPGTSAIPRRLGLALAATLVVAGASGGCFGSKSPRCDFGFRCPSDKVCAPLARTCVLPSQRDACEGEEDGVACTYPGGSPRSSCHLGVCQPDCGNGRVDPWEECDDGNLATGDGCGLTCLVERCGNGHVDPGEACDGSDLAGATCAGLLRGTPYGALACTAGCQVLSDGCYGAVDVAAGGRNGCAVLSTGAVSCWGDGRVGQLGASPGVLECGGDCSPDPVVIPGVSGAVAVTLGESHVCVLLEDGTVVCWGNDGYGQLGRGQRSAVCSDHYESWTHCSPVPEPVDLPERAVAVTAGSGHTCALLVDGRLFCWGSNDDGQLATASAPDPCNDIGTPLGCAFAPLQVTGLGVVIAVDAGPWSTCAVRVDGAVHCWGGNGYGNLGDGLPGHATCPADPDREWDRACEPVRVVGLGPARAVAAGSNHSCALLEDGTAACWGDGAYLGAGLTEFCSDPACASPPSPVSGLADVVRLSTSYEHTCAVQANDVATCWGWNLYGILGDGTEVLRTTPVPVTGLGPARVVSAGRYHTCAGLLDGSVWCWGSAESGQLGDGSLTVRATPGPLGGP